MNKKPKYYGWFALILLPGLIIMNAGKKDFQNDFGGALIVSIMATGIVMLCFYWPYKVRLNKWLKENNKNEEEDNLSDYENKKETNKSDEDRLETVEDKRLMSLVLAHDEITETQYNMDAMLRKKYTKMFRQYFDAVANIKKGKINDFNYTMYSFTPSNMYCGDGGRVGMFLKVVVVDTNPQRYFAVERSFHSQSMLCEWKFDGLEETEHLNYGPIISSLFDEMVLADILINKLKKILK